MWLSNCTFEEVLQSITNKSQNKVDQLVNLAALSAESNGGNSPMEYYLEASDPVKTQTLRFSDWALSQLLSSSKVPRDFYDRCSRILQEEIFNEHVGRNKSMLLRHTPGPKTEDGINRIRAVMSSTYGIMDDDQIFPIVIEHLKTAGISSCLSFEYDEHCTRMLVRFPQLEGTYNNVTMHTGLAVTNSETGHAAVWIEPVIYHNARPIRHRHALKQQGIEYRIIHRGEIDRERIQKMITDSQKIVQVGLVQMAEAWEKRISGAEVQTYFREINGVPERIKNIMIEQMEDVLALSKAETASRIIAFAQTLPLFQRAVLEEAAGAFVGLFNNYEQRFQNIMKDIS